MLVIWVLESVVHAALQYYGLFFSRIRGVIFYYFCSRFSLVVYFALACWFINIWYDWRHLAIRSLLPRVEDVVVLISVRLVLMGLSSRWFQIGKRPRKDDLLIVLKFNFIGCLMSSWWLSQLKNNLKNIMRKWLKA